MSVTIYNHKGINDYVVLINCLLNDATKANYSDYQHVQIQEVAKNIIRQINNDDKISDEDRALLPFLPEFRSLVHYAKTKTFGTM